MDTRSKILTPSAALALQPARPLLLATGYFDILRAEQAEALAQARRRTGAACLLVAVLPHAGELLPQPARAEMVAALRVVDYVLLAESEDPDRLADSLQPVEILRLEEVEVRRTRQLIQHVHRRQSC